MDRLSVALRRAVPPQRELSALRVCAHGRNSCASLGVLCVSAVDLALSAT